MVERRDVAGARAAPRRGAGANGVGPAGAGLMPLSLGVGGRAQNSRSAQRGKVDHLDVEEVRRANPIEEVVREHVDLRYRGPDDLIGLCLWHDERTPSMVVHPQRSFVHCFGCSVSADVFGVVEHVHGCSFRDALQLLAERAGIRPRTTTGAALASAAAERRRAWEHWETSLADFRQRWRNLIERHDEAEEECYIVEAARRWLPNDPLTRALTRRYGGAFERRRQLEGELDVLEAEERAWRATRPSVRVPGVRAA